MFLENKKINYQLTIVLISLSESIENIILIWLIYNYTNNPLIISLISLINYFPMFISAVTFIFIADSINPTYQYYINNIFFLLISFLIFCSFFYIQINIKICLILVFILQTLYSFIRTINRINSNKIVKLLFNKKESNEVIKISFSIIQIFQTFGNLIANFFILYNISLYGFILICFFYLINFYFSYKLLKYNKKHDFLLNKNLNKNENIDLFWFKKIFLNKKLFYIFFFSIPSSGIYQYLYTILPFISKIINYKSSIVYSSLNFSCAFFSTIIVYFLYKKIISRKFIEKYTFIICFFIFLFLSFTNNFYFILILNSICFSFLTGHMLCMQIKINKNSSYFNLGKFTIIRNSISSIAKIFFSFLSVIIFKKFNLMYVYFFISIISLLFQMIYIILKE